MGYVVQSYRKFARIDQVGRHDNPRTYCPVMQCVVRTYKGDEMVSPWRIILSAVQVHRHDIKNSAEASHIVPLHEVRALQRMSFLQEVKRRIFVITVHCHGHLLYATVQVRSCYTLWFWSLWHNVKVLLCPVPSRYLGRDSVVGIATRYGLDGPRIESRWE